MSAPLEVTGSAAEARPEAIRPAAIVGGGRCFSAADITTAMQALPPLQDINIETRAVHAAAEAMPFRAATIATTSRRMRVSSKSFGV